MPARPPSTVQGLPPSEVELWTQQRLCWSKASPRSLPVHGQRGTSTCRPSPVFGVRPYEEPSRFLPTLMPLGWRGAAPSRTRRLRGTSSTSTTRVTPLCGPHEPGPGPARLQRRHRIQSTLQDVVEIAARLPIRGSIWGSMPNGRGTRPWVAQRQDLERARLAARHTSRGFADFVDWLVANPSLAACTAWAGRVAGRRLQRRAPDAAELQGPAFDRDAGEGGGYVYTTNQRTSSRIASAAFRPHRRRSPSTAPASSTSVRDGFHRALLRRGVTPAHGRLDPAPPPSASPRAPDDPGLHFGRRRPPAALARRLVRSRAHQGVLPPR